MGRRGLALAALILVAPVLEAAAQTVMPARAIRSNTVLSAGDLTLGEETISGAVSAIEDAVGLEARETLYPGRPLLASQIGPPALVERNQPVRMTYSAGALSITADGRALDRGGLGEAVRVMNLTSRQTVTGKVTADGSIEVSR